MRNPATYRRRAAALCLVLAAAMSAVFMALAAAPGWGSDHVERLQAVADAGAPAALSFVAFVAYQLPLMVGLLGVAHLLRGRTPLLANLGATLAGVGAFGYAVYGGSQLVIPAMAADPTNIEVYAQLRSNAEALTEPFAAVGMVGSLLGLLLLSVALWRGRLGPRVLPVLFWTFFLVEFVGPAVVPSASLVSGGIFLLGLLGLARTVRHSPESAWVSTLDEESGRVSVTTGRA